MRTTLYTIALLLIFTAARAQSGNSGASQHLEMNMAEVVGAGFSSSTGGNGGVGSAVDLPMGGTAAMANGIESSDIQVQLQGTTAFDIQVQASSTNFTYSGSASTNNVMPVKDVLSLEVTANGTGGNISNGFNSYQPIEGGVPKKMISAGQAGVRTFSFKYKASPGFNYSAGTYTTSIVYTISKA